MRSARAALSLFLSLSLASCNHGCAGNNPPPDDPTNPPPVGWDCNATRTLPKLVKVDRAIVGSYIVVAKTAAARIQPLVQVEGVSAYQQLGARVAVARFTAAALARAQADPNVDFVQENGVKAVPETDTPIRIAAATAHWGLDRIDQRALPLDGTYAPGSDGTGVWAYIIDTGIDRTHPDLAGQVEDEGWSAHGGGPFSDGHGHGTHVAGTVAGATFGVASGARLVAVRVLDSNGSGSDADVIHGVEWATQDCVSKGRRCVFNMSLGGGASPALDRSVCSATAAGIAVFVAAGNEDELAQNGSPSRVRQAVCIGASDRRDREADFTNHGAVLDFYAPGVDITSALPGNQTGTWSGTSMATPHAAGVGALLLAREPLTPAELEARMGVDTTKDVLTGTGGGAMNPNSPNRLLYAPAPQPAISGR